MEKSLHYKKLAYKNDWKYTYIIYVNSIFLKRYSKLIFYVQSLRHLRVSVKYMYVIRGKNKSLFPGTYFLEHHQLFFSSMPPTLFPSTHVVLLPFTTKNVARALYFAPATINHQEPQNRIRTNSLTDDRRHSFDSLFFSYRSVYCWLFFSFYNSIIQF